jgi:hypothetical protein
MEKKDLSQRLAELEHRTDINFFEIQKRLENLDRLEARTKYNFLEIEKKFAALEEEIQQLGQRLAVGRSIEVEKRIEERIKELEDLVMLLEVEVVKLRERAAVPSLPTEMVSEIPTELSERVALIEKKIKMLEDKKFGKIPVERLRIEPRLQDIEEGLVTIQRQLKDEIARIEEELTGKALTIPAAERFVEKMKDEIEVLRSELTKAEVLKREIIELERDLARKSDFTKLQEVVRQDMAKMWKQIDRIGMMEKSIDTKLVDIEERLREATAAEIARHTASLDILRKDLDTRMLGLEKRIDKEISKEVREEVHKDLMAEIQRHRKEIDEIISKLDAELARIKPLLSAEEVKALNERIAGMEKRFEMDALKLVTKSLEEFAESFDKKYPDLATKNDFERLAAELYGKIAMIQAPDIYSLVRRIDNLEIRINELNSLVRTVTSRMPLVVE